MPNLDFNIGFFRDQALFPYGSYATFTVSAPIPVWDQNRGNILSAEAGLARSIEEPHRVELALTGNLATNYTNYKTNLDAVEYYRRYVLPDQVIAYRGTLLRRQIDINAQFGDLVAAQQVLATSVTTYLGLLGSLWTSVISVADMLQTDDLFQAAESVRGLPALPDLDSLPPLPCCHPAAACGKRAGRVRSDNATISHAGHAHAESGEADVRSTRKQQRDAAASIVVEPDPRSVRTDVSAGWNVHDAGSAGRRVFRAGSSDCTGAADTDRAAGGPRNLCRARPSARTPGDSRRTGARDPGRAERTAGAARAREWTDLGHSLSRRTRKQLAAGRSVGNQHCRWER